MFDLVIGFLCFGVLVCAGPTQAGEQFTAENPVPLLDFEEDLDQGAPANVQLELALVQRGVMSRIKAQTKALDGTSRGGTPLSEEPLRHRLHAHDPRDARPRNQKKLTHNG
jgi:hypothetical protein